MSFDAFVERFIQFEDTPTRLKGGKRKSEQIAFKKLYDSQHLLSRDRKGLNVKVKEYDQERCKTLEKRDDWALNGWGKLDNKDKEEKEDCRKWEDYARWETRPPTLSATEAFFKQTQATLCESCKSIPVVEMICSMSGKDSNTTESKIASEPDDGCGLCKILPNWNTENESNRPIVLPRVGSWLYFQLLNNWLNKCHGKHSHAMPEVLQQPSSTRRLLPGSQKERMPPAPRRLIDVDKMQLVEHDGEGKVYIALSHRWSKKERKAVDIFWSGGPSKDIDFRLLPIKFQNAATVTRRLGIQYLWIDGICINQDKTDVAEEEMREECSRMELIFCSAFCVIAILSEPDSANGFLSQRGTEGIPFNLPGGTEEPSLEIVNKSVDFSRDILEAEWNTRGWTFQERALACHTIYFTKSQAYWECEELTVCESQKHPVTMTSARNIYSYSDFPRPQNISSKLAIDMYRQYSRRGLSCKEDRPVAILGLEYRLALSYMCVSLFGVLRKGSYKPSLSDTCLHETLVWKSDAEPLRKIKFRVSNQNQVVPSWSWMSRTGAIDYVSLPTNFRGTEINIDYDLVGDFDESSDTFQKKHCQLRVEFRKKLGASLNIDPSNDSWIRVIDNSELVGAVSFDECDGCNGRCHGNLLQAAVIGSARGLLAQCELEGVDPRASDREQYIVLLVEKDPRMKEHATEPSDKQPSGAAEKTYYNRIGLGIFETGWLESSTKELVYVL